MDLFIFIGAICFSVFTTLCADNMRMLQIKITGKRDTVLFIAALIPPFVLSFIFGRNHMIGITQFLIITSIVMLIIAAFSKNFRKACLFSFYGIAVLSSYSAITVLFLDLFRLAEIIPENYWGCMNAAVAAVIIVICHLIKRLIKNRIDMNIFNNRMIHLLILISIILLAFIYINHIAGRTLIQIGNWLANPADIGYVLFLITSGFLFLLIMRYISRENAMRKEILCAEASKEYTRELEESYQQLQRRRDAEADAKAKPLKITVDERIMRIKMDEIICVETTHVRHKLRLHTKDHVYEINGELKSLEEQLDERFIRCHRSYLINKEKIVFINKKQNIAMMTNDLSCHVSRNGMKLL